MSHILVTGGAGYIGSHTVLELLEAGHEVSVVDNFSNSSPESLRRVELLTKKTIHVYPIDLCDATAIATPFAENSFDAVIHFAGLKAVGESVQEPLLYYRNNLVSTLNLCENMQKYKVRTLIFSSSATVYKQDEPSPWTEQTPAGVGIGSPYGRTKYMIEQILSDLSVVNPDWNCTILRYFNPVGAHPSGQIGEDPSGVPNNLMPFIAQVAVGKQPQLSVFGDDYDTPDGTCIRDYIHVVDLAKGHVAALDYATNKTEHGLDIFNLGSGKGSSVFEMLHAFEQAANTSIPYQVVSRRSGDAPLYYADPSKANSALGWKTHLSIEDICRDTWNWQSQNPNGYDKKEESA